MKGKKLGLLLSVSPAHQNFTHGLRLADAAVAEGVEVYLYCIDDAVTGLAHPLLQSLRSRGVKLFACAYGAQRRGVPPSDLATFAGLTIVSELLASTDRFVSFN